MIVKNYGIFDSIQEEYVRTFVAANDADAKRSAELIVRSQGFDSKTYKDRSIVHLFDFDSVTGLICDNTVRQVYLFATAIQEYDQEKLEKAVKEKLLTDDFVQEIKDLVIKQVSGEVVKDVKQA